MEFKGLEPASVGGYKISTEGGTDGPNPSLPCLNWPAAKGPKKLIGQKFKIPPRYFSNSDSLTVCPKRAFSHNRGCSQHLPIPKNIDL